MSEPTLSEKKNALIECAQEMFAEYIRTTETTLQYRCETDLKLREYIGTIRDQEMSIETHLQKIQQLESELAVKSKTMYEYEEMIRNLEDKLKEKLETDKQTEDSSNRFNMLRIQAKEISEKDREIERLNRLLLKSKEKVGKGKVSKDKSGKDKVSKETKDISGGWSPTRSQTPKPEVEVEPEPEVVVEPEPEVEVEPEPEVEVEPEPEVQSDLIDSVVNTISQKIQDVVDTPEELPEESPAESVEPEETGEIFKYRKKEYYSVIGDNEQVVYELLEGDGKGPRLGVWTLNKNGKRRVVLDK